MFINEEEKIDCPWPEFKCPIQQIVHGPIFDEVWCDATPDEQCPKCQENY